ncbi:MAG TPA: 2,3-bisphosphoglycerate-independent phosphoglycerate mutase [Candidatus Dojkabacteria bacterium]|jgi:2,3-bisphosphoglycerate-independent phosphoglycerate mutase
MVKFFNRPRPVLLLAMDGVGVAPPGPGNAVTLANTPFLDKLWPTYPHTYLKAAGLDVGLPHGVDGNSEVGHMNIGAGKVIYQDLPRIDLAIKDNTFFKNPTIIKGIEQMKEKKTNLHVMGLIGGGQVHSSLSHMLNLIKLLSQEKVPGERVFVHVFTDGRDSPPKNAGEYIQQLEMQMKAKGIGKIVSLVGRYYAMDRDERWDRTKKAYDLIANGIGKKVNSWIDGVEESYSQNKNDEYIEPYTILEGGEEQPGVNAGDVIMFINFRADRAIQLTQAFEDDNFIGFEREKIADLCFIGMTEYEKGFPRKPAFPPEHITNPLGKVISDNNMRQLRISESEKFPHVTYFLDCGNEEIYPGEDRIEVPSPKDVATYDQKPEMSAELVADILIQKIDEGAYDFIAVNFANPDMVAHTGVLEASIKAMEVTDSIVGRIVNKVLEKKGAVLITSDHGNCEELIDMQTGGVDTKHSTNPVPLIIVKEGEVPRELTVGILADIAPTILAILGIQKPPSMIGRNLLI